jgi:hypothetical protein
VSFGAGTVYAPDRQPAYEPQGKNQGQVRPYSSGAGTDTLENRTEEQAEEISSRDKMLECMK